MAAPQIPKVMDIYFNAKEGQRTTRRVECFPFMTVSHLASGDPHQEGFSARAFVPRHELANELDKGECNMDQQ